MSTVVLVIHLMVATALVASVLLQRSEGGALGIGGGGGGMMAGRGSANLLTRLTTFLAAAFFVTSITLTILSQRSIEPSSILDRLGGSQSAPSAPVSPDETQPDRGGILDKLQPSPPVAPRVPQSQ